MLFGSVFGITDERKGGESAEVEIEKGYEVPELVEFPENGVSYNSSVEATLDVKPWLREDVMCAMEGFLSDLMDIKLGIPLLEQTQDSENSLRSFVNGAPAVVCCRGELDIIISRRKGGGWEISGIFGGNKRLN